MKEKVTGFLSFFGALGWGIFGIYIIINEGKSVEFFPVLALMIASISTILYVIWTKFGQSKRNELQEIEYRNLILVKQIEQQELLKQLEK